ncbi:hypothetical protein Golax_007200 [Gossypium laxum]|uniref:DEAD-box RNA helicase Q domain-containing protein n=1 Tax=Gossypium laxum TaxID=34288 RepID=A0A7J9A635_9ROSI|nr:hypothetical protein [Gossypium laxum]
MGETRDNDAYEEELLDYEEEEEKAPDSVTAKVNGEGGKKGYVGIHSSGFRDFLLKPELLRAIVDSGFEHPSEGKSLTLLPFLYLLAFIYSSTFKATVMKLNFMDGLFFWLFVTLYF